MATSTPITPSNGVTATPTPRAISVAMARAVRAGAQPESVSMVAVKFGRIGPQGPLDTSVVDMQFTQDVHDTLGNLGTSSDGMDDLLNEMASLIDNDSQGVADANTLLDDITDTDYPTFEANTWTPIAGDLATFQDSGDAIVAQFNTHIVPPAPPADQPPDPCRPTLANPFPCGFGPPQGNGPNPI